MVVTKIYKVKIQLEHKFVDKEDSQFVFFLLKEKDSYIKYLTKVPTFEFDYETTESSNVFNEVYEIVKVNKAIKNIIIK